MAKRKYDLSGQRVSCLLVLEPCKTKYGSSAGWRCLCDCGNSCVKTTQQLTNVINGKYRFISCGCNRNRSEDITGKRFGKLVVLERANLHGSAEYRCRCDCGTTKIIKADYLLQGHTQSCGCGEAENRKTLWTRTHGGRAMVQGARSRRYNERLYDVWNAMKSRCYNPKVNCYHNYGGRGISVCEEWRHDFPAFQKWALDNGYDENAEYGKCTIDRIDVDGNYEPSNCRWVDMKVQSQNKRSRFA